MSLEVRTRWERQEPMPDGWRFCGNHYNPDTETMWSLWSDAPQDRPVRSGTTRWVKLVKVSETRHVTEWVRAT